MRWLHELRKIRLAVAQQRGVTVMHDGAVVGEYFVDLLVEQALLAASGDQACGQPGMSEFLCARR